MRKIIAMLSACSLLFLTGCQESASVGIIGGADGPTAILVTAAPLSEWIGVLVAGVIAAIIVGVIVAAVVIKKRNK